MAAEGDGGGRSGRFVFVGLAVLAIAGLAAFLADFVATRQGNLAWDDADYLRRGVRLARLVEDRGASALVEILSEDPKPPMLVAWIEAVALLAGHRDAVRLIVLSAVPPFVLLLIGVAGVARRLAGSRAMPVAVLVLAASPMALSYGAKVMVETFMGLWILGAYFGAALVLERPTRGRALLLGFCVGAAAMTKLTVLLLLPSPAIYVAWRLLAGDAPRRVKARVALWVLLPALAIAGPWYARHAENAVQFSMRAAQYNLLAEGKTSSTPVGQRLIGLGGDLAGWPVLAVLVVGGAARLASRRRDSIGEGPPVAREFARITLLGVGTGAVILLVPPHFDPRFLLPAWPAVAACAAGWLVRGGGVGRGLLACSALGMGVAFSGAEMLWGPSTTTHWSAGELIDELVTRHDARIIGNIGDSPDWNVCKTGLINELRGDPSGCSVVHDLSRVTDEELVGLLDRFDAIVVLDPAAFPPGFLAAAPGLNRSYEAIGSALGGDRFTPLETDATSNLPPMTIYLARDARGRSRQSIARAEAESTPGGGLGRRSPPGQTR